MKNADFVALLTANAAKTNNIRCYSKVWPSGARRVPRYILYKIGAIVSLIQHNIDKGIFCAPEKEGIIIYNFQPAMTHEDCQFCTIDCIKVPIEKLNYTKELIGTPLNIAVNLTTYEVVNNTQSMLDLGLIEADEIAAEGLEPPRIYGKYTDYEPTTAFVALYTSSNMSPEQLFSGELNEFDVVQKAPFFDSHLEAKEFLSEVTCKNKLIGEVAGSTKDSRKIKINGLSNYLLKILSTDLQVVTETFNTEVRAKESTIQDEIEMLEIAHKEEEVIPGDTIRISK